MPPTLVAFAFSFLRCSAPTWHARSTRSSSIAERRSLRLRATGVCVPGAEAQGETKAPPAPRAQRSDHAPSYAPTRGAVRGFRQGAARRLQRRTDRRRGSGRAPRLRRRVGAHVRSAGPRSRGGRAEMEVPDGFDAGRYRLVGNVAGAPPFRGHLTHHGWRRPFASFPPGRQRRLRADHCPGRSGTEIAGRNMTAKYVVGIDLGTTNSVLAYTSLEATNLRSSSLPFRNSWPPALSIRGPCCRRSSIWPTPRRPPAARTTCLGRQAATWRSASWPGARPRKSRTARWAPPSRGWRTAAWTATSRSCPGTRRPTCPRSRR